jgi:hypothetical protein
LVVASRTDVFRRKAEGMHTDCWLFVGDGVNAVQVDSMGGFGVFYPLRTSRAGISAS